MSLSTYLLVKYIKKRIARRRINRLELNSTGATTLDPVDLSPFAGMLDDETEGGTGLELPIFDFVMVAASTGNFHDGNKLGEGGFGPVYKGRLLTGPEIAVKRLSKRSLQGLEEFKNEVVLISKLQHRNLVRLLGCCIDGEEKLLLYEFMPNKSLDAFLFDSKKQGLLDWPRRHNIIEGVARGLLYLHRDSRLRIIHRDLKASNILLDEHFNAKISDFGMARIFYGDQLLGTTNKVVGTIGYMSPEYALEGRFSEKSDVFSFGVLLLEIVSGRRNNYILDDEEYLNLIGYSWTLWSKERILELVDPSLGESFPRSEVLKCIQVGLLCVQEYPTDRPAMSSVVSMLSSDTSLPTPKKAAFFGRRSPPDTTSSYMESTEICSKSDLTITDLHCR